MNKIALAFVALLLITAAVSYVPSHSQQLVIRLPFHQPGPPHHFISWSGSVDDTVNVYVQGGRVWEQVVSGQGLGGVNARVFNPLPPQREVVSLTNVRGRGQVWIVQQPHRRNGYTAIVRIRDPQPGRSNYHFRLIW
jgi:hypothetical protein